jgi:hypothetical protein
MAAMLTGGGARDFLGRRSKSRTARAACLHGQGMPGIDARVDLLKAALSALGETALGRRATDYSQAPGRRTGTIPDLAHPTPLVMAERTWGRVCGGGGNGMDQLVAG